MLVFYEGVAFIPNARLRQPARKVAGGGADSDVTATVIARELAKRVNLANSPGSKPSPA